MTEDIGRVGYMCLTDFTHELGQVDVESVWADEAALRAHEPCVEECGIVRVRILFDTVVTKANCPKD